MIKSACMTAALVMLLTACNDRETANLDEDVAAAPADAPATAGGSEVQGSAQRALATLQTTQGEVAGSATATASEAGVTISLNVEGLPPGPHGAHVHLAGRCDAPTFESAGGHWNPTDAQHGLEGPPGQHAGDMPNLTVNAEGRGSLEYRLQGASFEGLLDADGSAMMIHADADDQRTDPSGASGGRIACGVFRAG